MNSFAKFTGKTPVFLQLLKTVSGTGVLLVNFSQFEEYCFLGCLRVAAFEPLIIYSF